MGLDFLEKTAKPFHRSCQKGFDSFKRAYLFDPAVAPTERSFLAHVGNTSDLDEGLELVLRLTGNEIAVYREEREVGRCDNPPPSLTDKLRQSQGLAVGRLEALHSLSSSIDVVML